MKTEEKGLYDKNLELIRRYREGDAEAGEELALLNRPLIYKIAGRFSGRGTDYEELCEMGMLGFVKAVNTFDFSRGCAFSTYAVPLIFGEIRRFLRDDGMLKVSRESKRLSALLNAERERRINLGLSVDIEAIAEAVGISREDAAAALFATSPVRSLEEPEYSEDDSSTVGESVFDDEAERSDFEKLSIRLAMERLKENERKIIFLRYFRDYSQAEVAKVLGLTQVKVSREEKKILAILKPYLD